MIRRSWISLRQTWGCDLILLGSGCDGSGYYRVVHGIALIPNETQFPCRTLVACLVLDEKSVFMKSQWDEWEHGCILRKLVAMHWRTDKQLNSHGWAVVVVYGNAVRGLEQGKTLDSQRHGQRRNHAAKGSSRRAQRRCQADACVVAPCEVTGKVHRRLHVQHM